MTGVSDPLIASVCELCTALDERSIRPIIAGGLGLYLRELFVKQERQVRYPLPLDPRTTRDIDLFLTVEMIVDQRVVEALRDVLRDLGYSPRPEAFYFQFVRTSAADGDGRRTSRRVKVDLLAGVPDGESASLVTRAGPRIKPVGARGIHARRAPEAALIHVDPVQEDWKAAVRSRTAYADAHCFREARTIGRYLFGTESSLGFIRLQENEAFRASRDELDPYIEHIRDDLGELFEYDR